MGSVLNLNARPAPQYFAYSICDPDTSNNQLKINPDGSITVRSAPFTYTPLGYQQITSLASATNLTPPAGATMALISCSSSSVRWRDDGTSPTTGVGMPLAAGQEFQYSGNLTAIQFIAVSGSPVLDISYYK